MTQILKHTLLFLTVAFFTWVGCGKLGTVEHEGTVNTVISINETQLRKYFDIYCVDKLTTLEVPVPSAVAVAACTDDAIADFLATISGAK